MHGFRPNIGDAPESGDNSTYVYVIVTMSLLLMLVIVGYAREKTRNGQRRANRYFRQNNDGAMFRLGNILQSNEK